LNRYGRRSEPGLFEHSGCEQTEFTDTLSWTVDYPLQWALHPISAASNTVTFTQAENGVYSLIHVDWDTGEEVGRVTLGTNPIFNAAGGVSIPLNEKKIYVTGVFGAVRISRLAE
jgi:hypothetical protein